MHCLLLKMSQFFSSYYLDLINIDIACCNGYFGRKCLKTCGKCLNDKTCDSVNGTCIGGCGEGFKGEICKTGN